MPKGIPNTKPAEENDDVILARMIAEEAEQKAKADAERIERERLAEEQRLAAQEAAAEQAAKEAEAAKPKMVAMQLLRNYRPSGDFEIVGHMVPAVTRKDASGREYEVSKAAFVTGEMAPTPQAGVGTTGKIWAGTVIRVPQDEARTMRTNDIAERSVDD